MGEYPKNAENGQIEKTVNKYRKLKEPKPGKGGSLHKRIQMSKIMPLRQKESLNATKKEHCDK